MKKLFPILLGGLLLAALASCSSKQASVGDERLKWNQSTTVGDYEKFGQKDARWDAPVKEALTRYAKIRAGDDFDQETKLFIIGNAAEAAVKAGCEDPLVNFLYCNQVVRESAKPLKEKQAAFSAMAETMQNSSYSPIRKFYGNLFAAGMLWTRGETNLWLEVVKFRRGAIGNLAAALEDKTMPVEEAYHAAHQLFQVLARNNKELTDAYATIEKPLFKNWPKAGTAYLIQGEFNLKYAWLGRGHGTADRTTEEQWKNFKERLTAAETALNHAWSLNPKDPLIPTVMMSVVEGLDKPLAELDKWFARAMALDTNNVAACRQKLHFLLPQWNGSAEEMIAFGRECVASTKWGGHVPIILVDAHIDIAQTLPRDERGQYWLAPEVWPDLKLAYEKFALLNVDETRFRYAYAGYAVRCGQWAEFDRIIREIQSDGNDFNFNYFGGQAEFEKLATLSRERQAKK